MIIPTLQQTAPGEELLEKAPLWEHLWAGFAQQCLSHPRGSNPTSQCPWFSSFQCFLWRSVAFSELKQRGRCPAIRDQAGPSSWLGAFCRMRAANKHVIHSCREAASSSCQGMVGTGWEGALCSVPLCAFCVGNIAPHPQLLSPISCLHMELFDWTQQPGKPFTLSVFNQVLETAHDSCWIQSRPIASGSFCWSVNSKFYKKFPRVEFLLLTWHCLLSGKSHGNAKPQSSMIFSLIEHFLEDHPGSVLLWDLAIVRQGIKAELIKEVMGSKCKNQPYHSREWGQRIKLIVKLRGLLPMLTASGLGQTSGFLSGTESSSYLTIEMKSVELRSYSPKRSLKLWGMNTLLAVQMMLLITWVEGDETLSILWIEWEIKLPPHFKKASGGFPGGSRVKNLLAKQDMQVRSLGWKIPWRRKRQTTLVFLPGKSHGQRSLVSYLP